MTMLRCVRTLILLAVLAVLAVLVGATGGTASSAADWSTWRGGPARQAVTPEQLPAELHLQWTLPLPAAAPAWPEDPRLQFDANYEPVVVGTQLFLASNVDDSVTAIDVASGREMWRFFAGGPVRFAPVVAEGQVCFGADDGCVYCLKAADGTLRWKHDAAPSLRKVLGNERLVSVWPIRGGMVLADGKLFFAAGVWPFEGTFLAAVDALTGKPTSVADTGTTAPVLLKERTPQGYLAAVGHQIFIPCGRSTVAVFDRGTGDFVPYTYRTSEVTSYHAAVSGRWLLHGAQAFDMETKTSANVAARNAVLAGDTAYFGEKGTIQAIDLVNPKLIEGKDRYGKEARRTEVGKRWTWSWDEAHGIATVPPVKGAKPVLVPAIQVNLLAGRQLYAQRESTVFALYLADKVDTAPRLGWQTTVEGTPATMIAAASRLFVVTREGAILCFGGDKVEPKTLKPNAPPVATVTNTPETLRVAEILERSGVRDGYAVALGLADGPLLAQLAHKSNLRVLSIEPKSAETTVARRYLASLGLYGARVSIAEADPLAAQLPPYIASLVVCDLKVTDSVVRDGQGLIDIFRILRPYGGVAMFRTSDSEHAQLVRRIADAQLAGAEARHEGSWTVLVRAGALPGAANWTHEYGDPANTLMSQDELVRAPLGVLWFGGPAANGELFYNRHFWGPSMAVIDGRMLVQGPKKLSAIDVYTGRVLWKKELEHDDRNNPGRRGEDFEKMLAGYNFVAVPDAIYVIQGKDCLSLSPQTGQETARWQLPKDDRWGTIRVQEDVLVAEAFPDQGDHSDKPRRLVALDRRSGKVLWSREANQSFPVVAVGPDLVYCFDADIEDFYLDWKRKGLVPKANEIRLLKAFDLRTGKPAWERSTDQVVTWLGYSAAQDVLVSSNKQHIGARRGKDGEELWKKDAEGLGFKGHPESLWDKLIIWKDRILDQRGPGLSYDLKTGESTRQVHPATGEPIDWEFTKAGHHCNYAIANPHLMTFRADTAGFCDIESGNTARLEGFRSGCRNSLIPANGVLNSPNFAHGCVCGYSLFTSLALVHVPDNELWGYNALKTGEQPVRRIGINLGGRGDRVSTRGTLWLEYPNVTGTLLGTTVKVEGQNPKWYQLHSSFVQGDAESLPWVAASGVEGASVVTVRWEDEKKAQPRRYRVRLYFVEPDAKTAAGDRVFDVKLQGQTALGDLDVAAAAGGSLRTLVKQVDDVAATGELRIEFAPRKPALGAVLSGVEIETLEKK